MNQASWPVVVAAIVYLLAPIVVIVCGLCSVLKPRWIWFLAEGWKFKNAEPSGCVLVLTRIGGLFSILVGVVLALFIYGIVKVK